MINVQNFIMDFKAKKVQNTKINEHAVSEHIKKTLEVKTYIPFMEKKSIAEMVVAQNTKEVNGVKKHDSISAYVSFVVAMLTSHTCLEFSENPVTDYDLLAESGLLPLIITEFKADYDDCEILLKMALASELEDNNIGMLVGKFLNGISFMLDFAKDKLASVNMSDVLGANFKEEDLAKLSSFLNKYNK